MSNEGRDDDFDYDDRVLICEGCREPIDCPDTSTTITCGHCGTKRSLQARRQAKEIVHREPAVDEATRLTRLRAQVGKGFRPIPDELVGFFEGGVAKQDTLNKLEELCSWKRQALAAGRGSKHDAELVFFATRGLADALKSGKRRRAVVEAALEVHPGARERQCFLCILAEGAARLNDHESSAKWLARCDPIADDAVADSEYRMTVAALARRQGKPSEVLALLGSEFGSVPLEAAFVSWCALLRADAHEALGHTDVAVDQLIYRRRMDADRVPEDYCKESHPLALAQEKVIDTKGFRFKSENVSKLRTTIAHKPGVVVHGLVDIEENRTRELVEGYLAVAELEFPPEAFGLFKGGTLPPKNIDALHEIWAEHCRRARELETPGVDSYLPSLKRVLFLMLDAKDRAMAKRRRSVLMTALELGKHLNSLPDGRRYALAKDLQVTRCQLAVAAIDAGDLDAAASWLSRCDPNSWKLLDHSAYVWARSELATARGDYAEVLRLLGDRYDDLVLAPHELTATSLLRANALEHSGRVRGAIRTLSQAIRAGDGDVFERHFAQRRTEDFCAQSFAPALALARQRKATIRLGIGVFVAVGGSLSLYLALNPKKLDLAAFVLAPFAALGAGGLVWMFGMRRFQRLLTPKSS